MLSKKHLIRIALSASACLAAVAFTGLPWADASSHSPGDTALAAASHHKVCPGKNRVEIRYDLDDTPACVTRLVGKQGFRGHTGHRGKTGKTGKTGPVGPQGAVGPTGPIGPTGAIGATGATGGTGPTGPTGASGAFVTGSTGVSGGPDAGDNTVVVLGSKVQLTIQSGPMTGLEMSPSVAKCPSSGPDQQAFDGGAYITVSDTTHDVVWVQKAFPGNYAGSSEVDPLPINGAPGSLSLQPANAYEVVAVIQTVTSGSQVTVQSYVECGP
jgi:hypothetical protein